MIRSLRCLCTCLGVALLACCSSSQGSDVAGPCEAAGSGYRCGSTVYPACPKAILEPCTAPWSQPCMACWTDDVRYELSECRCGVLLDGGEIIPYDGGSGELGSWSCTHTGQSCSGG
jgi:hypothetical protein